MSRRGRSRVADGRHKMRRARDSRLAYMGNRRGEGWVYVRKGKALIKAACE